MEKAFRAMGASQPRAGQQLSHFWLMLCSCWGRQRSDHPRPSERCVHQVSSTFSRMETGFTPGLFVAFEGSQWQAALCTLQPHNVSALWPGLNGTSPFLRVPLNPCFCCYSLGLAGGGWGSLNLSAALSRVE